MKTFTKAATTFGLCVLVGTASASYTVLVAWQVTR